MPEQAVDVSAQRAGSAALLKNALWLGLTLLVIALDYWTKWLATTYLQYGQPVEVLPVFDWMLVHNTGAAFSFLSDAGGWQRWFFAIVSALVSLGLLIWLLRLRSGDRLLAAALALILGGALGNLWDRVTLGYVVDFISVHYQQRYFPAFNVADSAITIGAGLLILDMLIHPDKHK